MKFAILKLILSITIIILCCNFISSLKSGIGMATNLKSGMYSLHKMSFENLLSKHKKNQNQSNTKTIELNRLNSKILFQGWIKYFKNLDDNTQRKPRGFFKNPIYERESKRKHLTGEVNNLNKIKLNLFHRKKSPQINISMESCSLVV